MNPARKKNPRQTTQVAGPEKPAPGLPLPPQQPQTDRQLAWREIFASSGIEPDADKWFQKENRPRPGEGHGAPLSGHIQITFLLSDSI